MPEVHLSLSFRVTLLVLAAALSFAVSWYLYRVTIPPIPRTLKGVLITLRALGILTLVLLLGEPLLSLLSRSVEKPTVAILVDNSKSMTLKDHDGSRSEELIRALRSASFEQLKSVGDTRYELFDDRARPLLSFTVDSLKLNGETTDIGASLNSIKREAASRNIQSVVLVTDGNSTVGANPLYDAEDLALPIFTVGIGDTSEQKDVLVKNVIANDITYVGNRVPVRAVVRSSGYQGERVEVILRQTPVAGQSGEVLDRKVLTLEQGTADYPVEFSFVPQQEGTQKFSVEVSRLNDELTERNNRVDFFTKVLKSKMRVVLVAGGPSQDAAFIRRALQGDENVEVRPFIEKLNGQFYEGSFTRQTVEEADCIVVTGFPTASSSPQAISGIADAVTSGKPLFIVLGRTVDFSKLRSFESALPFSTLQVTPNEFQTFITIQESQRNNPIIKLASNQNPVDAWSKLAPIFRLQATFKSKPESEVIGLARIQSVTMQEPLLISRNVNHRKSIAVLGYGVWRWDMLSDPGSGTEHLLDQFLGNSVRWLTTREDDRRLRVHPSKEFFSVQDPVEFVAQVYDESYQPVDDARVTVSVARKNETNELTLLTLGNGQYEGIIDRLEEGDYAYTAKVTRNGVEAGTERGSFSVGSLNVEFQETRMNKPLLEQIAAHTGGKYYESTSLQSLASDIAALPNFKPRELTTAREFELWNSQEMMILAIALFALEWFLRKRKGML
ncbi:MAG: vWA domain-containing protein [Bacteroidota bacterium]